MISTVSTLGSSSAEARTVGVAQQEANAQRADAGMAEVLRLIRVSLLLRVVPALVSVIFALASGVPTVWGVAAVLIQPSLILFIVASMLARRGDVTVRQVRVLLALTIFVYTFEFMAMAAVSFVTDNAGWAWPARVLSEEDVRQVSTSAPIPLFFLLIPVILGAWVDGRRGWWKWVSVLIALTAVGALTVGQFIPNATLAPFSFVALGLVTLVVCYFVGSLADQQRAEHAQLEQANRKLAEQAFVREQLATSRERMRLSRDLHDTVAHKLAALSVQVNAIDAVLRDPASDDPEIVRQEVERARVLVREGLDDARRAIGGLRANAVEDLGLAAALAKLAESVSQRGGLEVTFERRGDDPALPADAANALYLIAQEALNNVERHAQAQHAFVTFDGGTPQAPVVIIHVADDGIGFGPAVNSKDAQRFGLIGMRERAELIGAQLRVDSQLDAGTTVTVSLAY
jgi:signal transduction histidine kinase